MELVSIRPYLPVAQGGDIILNCVDHANHGKRLSLIVGEGLLFDRPRLEGYVRFMLRNPLDIPADEDWDDFVRRLWAASTQGDTAPQPQELCVRDAADADRTIRQTSSRALTVDESTRSVEAILATDGAVSVYSWEVGGIIDERLLINGADLPAQCPILDAHDRSTVGNVLGSVRDMRQEGTTLVGRLMFAEDPKAQDTFRKIRDGHLTDVSIGYKASEYVDIPAGQSRTVNGLSYTAGQRTLRITSRFTVREVSVVPVGADPSAKMRGEPSLFNINSGVRPPGVSERDLLTGGLCHRIGVTPKDERLAEASWDYRRISLIDCAREALRMDGQTPPVEPNQIAYRAVSSGSLATIFGETARVVLLQAYSGLEDTTLGWTDEMDVPSFTAFKIVQPEVVTADRLPRGGTARHAVLNESIAQTMAIARYTKMAIVDEQDIINNNTFALSDLPKQMGEACRRVRIDLAYARLLANAALPDGVPLFDSGHSNVGTTALSSPGISAACAAIAAHRQAGVPLNLKAKYLLCPPDLRISAAAAINGIETKDDAGNQNEPIVLRSEARLGASGVVDPADGSAYVGSATGYILSAQGGYTVRLFFRENTGRQPEVRWGNLSSGRWGIWIDAKFDVGAAVLAHQGLFYSSGTGA